MKRLLAIALLVSPGGAALAQLAPLNASFARSASDQFVVHGSPQASRSALAQALATNANYVELAPARLAVSSERIKQALYRELGETSLWRGRIHLHLQPVRAVDEPVTIVSERFSDRWTFRLALPQVVERQRLIRALVQSLLMEIANRKTAGHAGEVPAWLAEGLTQRLLALPDIELTPAETQWAADGRALSPTVFDIRKAMPRASVVVTNVPVADGARMIWTDPLEDMRRQLGGRPPLTLEEVSWPTDEQQSGEAYRRSAQLLVGELLRLKDGQECLRAMLAELPTCYNWQTAFFRAFHAHFARQLDLEKWWALQVVNLTGHDPVRLMTVEETWRELDQLLRASADVRLAATELPARSDVTLQVIIMQWDQTQQTPVLQTKVRDLELLRLRGAPEVAGPIEEYVKVLSGYLRQRDKVGLILTSTTRDTNTRLKFIVRDTVKKLDALDARRAALKPAPESSSPDLVEGRTPPSP